VFSWTQNTLQVTLDLKENKDTYKVLVRPVVTYESETWTLTKADERSLGIFERKILRCIFGAVQENGQWRRYKLNYINYMISQT
jgi:hypothetical protein